MIIHKYTGPHYPLSVEFSPYGFEPAGIGNGEMKAALVEVVPVFGSNDMCQRISKVERYHFWISGSTGSKTDNHRIVVAVHFRDWYKFGSIFYSPVKIFPPFGNDRSYGYQVFD